MDPRRKTEQWALFYGPSHPYIYLSTSYSVLRTHLSIQYSCHKPKSLSVSQSTSIGKILTGNAHNLMLRVCIFDHHAYLQLYPSREWHLSQGRCLSRNNIHLHKTPTKTKQKQKNVLSPGWSGGELYPVSSPNNVYTLLFYLFPKILSRHSKRREKRQQKSEI